MAGIYFKCVVDLKQQAGGMVLDMGRSSLLILTELLGSLVVGSYGLGVIREVQVLEEDQKS